MKRYRMQTVGVASILVCVVNCGGSNRDAFDGDRPAEVEYPSDDPPPEAESCVDSAAEVTRAVDIIVTVDQSGSMTQELDQVTSNINLLPPMLAASGLDYRVVMVTKFGRGSGLACVPPPLGGENCGSNGTIFRAVDFQVNSRDALAVLLNTLDSRVPELGWRDFLRPNVLKVFVPVTDDDSQMSAPVFDGELVTRSDALFGTVHDRNYTFFPVIGASDFPATAKCGTSDAPGVQYQKLALLTNGKWFSVCKPSFGPMLEAIGRAVIARTACEVAIPEAPSGVVLDLEKINVRLASANGSAVVVPQDAAHPCADGAEGWQFSSDKKKIIICGEPCAAAQADLSVKLTVGFGCDTITR